MVIVSQWAASGFDVNDYTPFRKFSCRKTIDINDVDPCEIKLVSLPEGNSKHSGAIGSFWGKGKGCPIPALFLQLQVRAACWCHLGILVLNRAAQPTFSKHSFSPSFHPSTKFTCKTIRISQKEVTSCQTNVRAELVLPKYRPALTGNVGQSNAGMPPNSPYLSFQLDMLFFHSWKCWTTKTKQ